MTFLRIVIPLLEHDLFPEIVPTPDQVRAGLFRDHSLGAGVFRSAAEAGLPDTMKDIATT
jgi:hypothetical protein